MKKILLLTLSLVFVLAFTVQTQDRNQSSNQSSGERRKEIAVTFDDLPAAYGDLAVWEALTAKLLSSVQRQGVPAIGFVNEGKLYRNGVLNPRAVALLRQWLDAGIELGNHTYSHIAIDRASLEQYQQDVIRGETVTRGLLAERGRKLRYFRHTQLRTGPTLEYKQGLDNFLAARGYTIAPVTLDSNEYLFARVYSEAKARRDTATMKRVAEAYLPYMESVFAHFERLSQSFLGYQVKQTLLLHANELNADYFDSFAQMLKRRGYAFITLEQALRDEAYRLPEAQTTRGLSWLHRWMLAKGLPMEPEPAEPEFILQLNRALQR